MNKKKRLLFSILFLLLAGFLLFFNFQNIHLKTAQNISHKADQQTLYYWGDIPKFNPIQPDGLYVWWLQNLVWDRLIQIDSHKVWTPYLATSWIFNKDQTVLTLEIPKDLKWSNGRSVEEKDFQFSFEYYKYQNFYGAIYGPLLQKIKKMSFKENRLTLVLAENTSQDKRYASHIYWSEILSVVRLYPYDLDKNPYLGTGAYKVSDFSSRKPWQMHFNKRSWFWNKYSRKNFPLKLNIKTVAAIPLLKKITTSSEGLILGADLFEKGVDSWSSVHEENFSTSIVFNLKKTDLKFRKDIFAKINEINDLEKINLKLKDFKPKVDRRFNNSRQVQNLDLLYSLDAHDVWIFYLKEKLKKSNLNLNPIKISQKKLNESILKGDFIAYIDSYSEDEFYPHYLSYHSEGEYNFLGWNRLEMDKLLLKILDQSSSKDIQIMINEFKKYMDQELFEVPLFSYKNSVLWTRNPCKPIQTQFQRLGLIYKGIICADNQ